MNSRNLKVYEAPGSKRYIPLIKLQGNWLEQAGYKVGDQIEVELLGTTICISKKEAGNTKRA